MDGFLLRLQNEQEELSIKINKLEEFFGSKNFIELSFAQQFLLKEQCIAMHRYNDILRIRLETLRVV